LIGDRDVFFFSFPFFLHPSTSLRSTEYGEEEVAKAQNKIGTERKLCSDSLGQQIQIQETRPGKVFLRAKVNLSNVIHPCSITLASLFSSFLFALL
jgi:hypothetical protein